MYNVSLYFLYIFSFFYSLRNRPEKRCKGTTKFWIVQVFWQENFSTISKSYPKQNRISHIYSILQFFKCSKVFQNQKFSTHLTDYFPKKNSPAFLRSCSRIVHHARSFTMGYPDYSRIAPCALYLTPFFSMISWPFSNFLIAFSSALASSRASGKSKWNSKWAIWPFTSP